MESFEGLINTIDGILNTRRKRHITGGILISVSALFGCLAITVMTIKKEEEPKNDQRNIDICSRGSDRSSSVVDDVEE